MKKIIFIVILGCITSCTDNLPKYSCVYYSMIDNYPKGVKEMDFESRDICCILKFTIVAMILFIYLVMD